MSRDDEAPQYPEQLIERSERPPSERHPIRLTLTLTDFQVLVAGGVTTHKVRDPAPQTVQLTIADVSFDQMYLGIETAMEMQGLIGNQQKSDTVTTKLFEVIEHMEQALVQASIQIESFGNMITDPEARAYATDAIKFNMGKLATVQDLVDQLRTIIRPQDTDELEVETVSPAIPD